MKPGLSIVIPARQEARLADTILSACRGSQGWPLEILVMSDGLEPGTLPNSIPSHVRVRIAKPSTDQPRGVDSRRDAGGLAATNDTLLLLDAHCLLPEDGLPWAEYLTTWVDAHPHAIACCQCVGLDDGWEHQQGLWGKRWPGCAVQHVITPPARYYGARLQLTGHDGGTNRIFIDKWADKPAQSDGPAPIACPLGGAYVLSKSWYEQLGRPWLGMRGWGASEATLALVNWFMGGEAYCLPIPVGHYFRSVPSYQPAAAAELLFNQLRLLHMLPVPEDLHDELAGWLLTSNPCYGGPVWPACMAALDQDQHWRRLRAQLDGCKRTWSDAVTHFGFQLQEALPVR